MNNINSKLLIDEYKKHIFIFRRYYNLYLEL